MRYPAGHNDDVRRRIVETASRLMRKDGIDGVSIPKLMKAAGLTHGGFYVHFKDRDELVAAAIEHAIEESAFAGDKTAAESFDRYLSMGHVDHPEIGCVVATLGDEGSRTRGLVKRAFGEAVRVLFARIEKKLFPRSTKGELHDETLRRASQAVGSVILARLVHDPALAARILQVAKDDLAP